MGVAGTRINEVVSPTVTGRGSRGVADEDDMEESISPIEFTRNNPDGGRDGLGLDFGWDETSPGPGGRSAVESRAYF